MKLPTLLKRLESLKNNIEQMNETLSSKGVIGISPAGVNAAIKDVKSLIKKQERENAEA